MTIPKQRNCNSNTGRKKEQLSKQKEGCCLHISSAHFLINFPIFITLKSYPYIFPILTVILCLTTFYNVCPEEGNQILKWENMDLVLTFYKITNLLLAKCLNCFVIQCKQSTKMRRKSDHSSLPLLLPMNAKSKYLVSWLMFQSNVEQCLHFLLLWLMYPFLGNRPPAYKVHIPYNVLSTCVTISHTMKY